MAVLAVLYVARLPPRGCCIKVLKVPSLVWRCFEAGSASRPWLRSLLGDRGDVAAHLLRFSRPIRPPVELCLGRHCRALGAAYAVSEPHRWKQSCLQKRYSLLRAAVKRNRTTEPSNKTQHPACSRLRPRRHRRDGRSTHKQKCPSTKRSKNASTARTSGTS